MTANGIDVTFDHYNIIVTIREVWYMAEGKTTSLNLREFPDELHRQAKVKAAMMRISLKEFIIRAMTEYLKKQK